MLRDEKHFSSINSSKTDESKMNYPEPNLTSLGQLDILLHKTHLMTLFMFFRSKQE